MGSPATDRIVLSPPPRQTRPEEYETLIDREVWAFIARTEHSFPPETTDLPIEQLRAIAGGDFARISSFFDANIFYPALLPLA